VLLRVLSWNVHGCVDYRGRYRPGDIVDQLEAMGADIVALQEIETGPGARGDGRDLRQLLTRTVAPYQVFAGTLQRAAGSYGHILLSRFPVERARIIDLPRLDVEPRKLIHGRLRVNEQPVDVFAAHLGFRRREQSEQIRAVARQMKRASGAAILLGDLNERFRRGATFRAMSPGFESAPRRATFPSRWPVLPLDQIWFSGFDIVHSRVAREAGRLSDHLPITAGLRLPARLHRSE